MLSHTFLILSANCSLLVTFSILYNCGCLKQLAITNNNTFGNSGRAINTSVACLYNRSVTTPLDSNAVCNDAFKERRLHWRLGGKTIPGSVMVRSAKLAGVVTTPHISDQSAQFSKPHFIATGFSIMQSLTLGKTQQPYSPLFQQYLITVKPQAQVDDRSSNRRLDGV